MSLVHNERTKLTATWANTLATAAMAAGLFAPLAALLYGLTELRIGLLGVCLTFLGCLGLGLSLHVAGWLWLGRLRE
jgi:hypothetical protein